MSSFSLGAWNNGGTMQRFSQGILSDFRLWSVERSAEEIANNMANGSLTGNEDGLVGYWKFNEGTGTVAGDSASVKHNGTIYGGAAWVSSSGQTANTTVNGGSTLFSAAVETASITVNAVNHAPSDITLSSSSVPENTPVGATIGSFSTTDIDSGDSFTYTLVEGTGSDDNSSFTIDGDSLKLGVALDYETKNSYNIRVRSTDAGGLYTEKQFTIIITDVGYSVSYNANGATSGSVPTDSGSYEQGVTVTVLGNTGNLAKTGYTFAGWNTKADGTGTNYTAGQTFTMGSANVTLYAKWTATGGNSGSISSGGTAQTPSNSVPVSVDGKAQQQAATVSTQTQEGKTVTTVTLDAQKITESLNSAQSGSTVVVPVAGKTDVVVGELNGQVVKAMENKQAVLEIKTDAATYTLPAQQINIDAVLSKLGQDVKLSDIKVSIEIAKTSQETVKVVEDTASKGSFSIVVPPVEFSVKCTYGDKTVEVSRFNSYVERTVAIPDGVDWTKITTGVIMEPDGTIRHVPTKVIIINGKYYAKINSLTNSTYSVIWNPKEFRDVTNHWAKEAVNDMGSRLVVSGVSKDMFDPDGDITRAEFTAIIVRGLGLKPGTGSNPFADVSDDVWYCDYVKTAVEYKLIFGYGNGKFGPQDKITREQAITIIARAMNITGLKVELTSGEMKKLLAGFVDADKSADYARNSIAACKKAGIVTGRNGNLLAPKDNITRAETAVMVRRLLQKSDLI